jgi:hypothetical protein
MAKFLGRETMGEEFGWSGKLAGGEVNFRNDK